MGQLVNGVFKSDYDGDQIDALLGLVEEQVSSITSVSGFVGACQTARAGAVSAAGTAETAASNAEAYANDAATSAAASLASAAASAASAEEAYGYAQQAAAHTDLPIIRGASGTNSVIVGDIVHNIADADYAYAEGYKTSAKDHYSHAEGYRTVAYAYAAHAEGNNTTADGGAAHAEGGDTTASAEYSHAEGSHTTASGTFSHAEGNLTTASGERSHAEGSNTIANHRSQHVFGEFNVADTNAASATSRGDYVEIVGNGTADNAKANARTLDWYGNEVLAGKLTLGALPTADMDAMPRVMVPRKDLLINSYFVGGDSQQGGGQFPINQRGYASYNSATDATGKAYCVDGWMIPNNATTITIPQDGSGITISPKSGNANGEMLQFVEPSVIDRLRGKNVTVSLLLSDGTLLTGSGEVPASNPGGSVEVAHSSTSDSVQIAFGYWLTAPRETKWYCTIRNKSSSSITVVAAKLELGSIQTLAHQESGEWIPNSIPRYDEELRKCQRYLVVLNPDGMAYAVLGTATAYSGTSATLAIPLPTTMRGKAGATIATLVGSWCLAQGSNRYALTSINSSPNDGISGSIFSCTPKVNSGLTTGAAYAVYSNNDSTARCIISSEL